MLLISQNIKNHYNLEIPDDVVLRINLAWCNNLEELKEKLADNTKLFKTESMVERTIDKFRSSGRIFERNGRLKKV